MIRNAPCEISSRYAIWGLQACIDFHTRDYITCDYLLIRVSRCRFKFIKLCILINILFDKSTNIVPLRYAALSKIEQS